MRDALRVLVRADAAGVLLSREGAGGVLLSSCSLPSPSPSSIGSNSGPLSSRVGESRSKPSGSCWKANGAMFSFTLRIQLERLPLPHIGFGPFEGNAGEVCQHFVCLHPWEVLLYELVALGFLPLANVCRLLDVLSVDSVEPNVVGIVVYINAVVFRFLHVLTLVL